MNNARENLKLRITQSLIIVFSVMVIVLTVFCSNAFSQTAAMAAANENSKEQNLEIQKAQIDEMKFALIAAAAAFGLGAIGAGLAISHVGAAAMGAIAEKPQVGGQALIFIALGEGIVIFGFITAIMIIGKV